MTNRVMAGHNQQVVKGLTPEIVSQLRSLDGQSLTSCNQSFGNTRRLLAAATALLSAEIERQHEVELVALAHLIDPSFRLSLLEYLS